MEIYIAFVRTSREGWNSLSVRWKSKREQVIETFMRIGGSQKDAAGHVWNEKPRWLIAEVYCLLGWYKVSVRLGGIPIWRAVAWLLQKIARTGEGGVPYIRKIS